MAENAQNLSNDGIKKLDEKIEKSHISESSAKVWSRED